MNKRTYLIHKRYKALQDNDRSELNSVKYHEDQQIWGQSSEEEDEEDYDEDDDENEISTDGGGFEFTGDLLATPLNDMPIPQLVALLSQVLTHLVLSLTHTLHH